MTYIICEEKGYQIGIPLGIVGLTVYEFTFKGQSSQAGPTSRNRRRDALVGASKLVTRIRDFARNEEDLRATVGILNVKPNIYNAIPREVKLTLDVRSTNKNKMEMAINKAIEISKEIAEEENLEIKYIHLWTVQQVNFSEDAIKTIEKACKELNMRYKFMYSWAGKLARVVWSVWYNKPYEPK
jgi:N-carbamoyl-L-amino-acid hydrolase